MAKKEKDWKETLFEYGLGFMGDGVKNIYEHAIVRINEFMDDTQRRVEEFLVKVTKTTVLVAIFLMGAIFILVGASQSISDILGQVGVGYVIVGFALLAVGFIVRLLK